MLLNIQGGKGAIGAVPMPAWTLSIQCTFLNFQMLAPLSLCLRAFSGHKRPLDQCTQQTKNFRELRNYVPLGASLKL